MNSVIDSYMSLVDAETALQSSGLDLEERTLALNAIERERAQFVCDSVVSELMQRAVILETERVGLAGELEDRTAQLREVCAALGPRIDSDQLRTSLAVDIEPKDELSDQQLVIRLIHGCKDKFEATGLMAGQPEFTLWFQDEGEVDGYDYRFAENNVNALMALGVASKNVVSKSFGHLSHQIRKMRKEIASSHYELEDFGIAHIEPGHRDDDIAYIRVKDPELFFRNVAKANGFGPASIAATMAVSYIQTEQHAETSEQTN